MRSPLFQLIIIKIKSFIREPETIFWALIFPILISWVLGIAFTNSKERSATVMVLNNSRNILLEKTTNSSNEILVGEDIKSPVKIKFLQGDSSDALRAIRKGEITLFVGENNGKIHYHFDPKNTEAQQIFLMLEREHNYSKDRISSTEVKALTSLGNRYIDFLIPGLIALGIMNSCLWGISYNLIDFRVKKLLRRLIATPMKKSDFLLATIITRVIVTSIEAFILFLFAYFYFSVPFTGSFAALVIVFLSGVIAFSGIGIIISARAKNSQVGNGIINAVALPMTILSGIFFNYHNFPEWAIKIIKVLPLTTLADSLRSTFLEGAGTSSIVFPSMLLLAEGLIFFYVGLKIFKWH